MKALITRKVGMTSTIAEDGVVQAVTLLSVGEHTVLQHKTAEKDGYTAVQVGTETAKKLSKSVAGHVKNAKVMPKIIREFRLDEIPEELNVGSKISADVFSVGDTVHVTGLTKGKGLGRHHPPPQLPPPAQNPRRQGQYPQAGLHRLDVSAAYF